MEEPFGEGSLVFIVPACGVEKQRVIVYITNTNLSLVLWGLILDKLDGYNRADWKLKLHWKMALGTKTLTWHLSLSLCNVIFFITQKWKKWMQTFWRNHIAWIQFTKLFSAAETFLYPAPQSKISPKCYYSTRHGLHCLWKKSFQKKVTADAKILGWFRRHVFPY